MESVQKTKDFKVPFILILGNMSVGVSYTCTGIVRTVRGGSYEAIL